MKQFFLKWLPVQERLKPGNRFVRDGKVEQVMGDLQGSILSRSKTPKVKMFLCSRELKIGDVGVEKLTSGEYEQFQIDTENDIFPDMIAKGEQFKVIGLISPSAVPLFREGDEFNDDEWDDVADNAYFRTTTYIKLKQPNGTFI